MVGSISIHSPHVRGDAPGILYLQGRTISIHSPHARGDIFVGLSGKSPLNFNPLPSCEGRLSIWHENVRNEAFQSTPLMRGETA